VQTYYPITPAADESEYIEENQVFEITGSNKTGGILLCKQRMRLLV